MPLDLLDCKVDSHSLVDKVYYYELALVLDFGVHYDPGKERYGMKVTMSMAGIVSARGSKRVRCGVGMK